MPSVTPSAHGAEAPPVDDDLEDVPAAVVEVEIPPSPEDTTKSGVVAVVPWEGSGSFIVRLWRTAHLSTTAAESFFAHLPPGDTTAALRFAVLAEVLAVTGWCLLFALPVALIIFPGLPAWLMESAELRGVLLRVVAVVIPGLSTTMVILHALHGWGLDRAARLEGSRADKPRGLRFGFYSCGWDLLTLPSGLFLVLITEGPRAMLRVAPLGMTVPGKASSAYLRSIHGLGPEAARRAAGRAVTFAGGLFVVVALVSTAVVVSVMLAALT